MNLTNNKVYIGTHKVWNNNKKDNYICSSTLVKSLIKLNPNNWKKYIIARFSTAKEANQYERYFINKYDSYKNGYNRSKNGGNYTSKGIKINYDKSKYRRHGRSKMPMSNSRKK